MTSPPRPTDEQQGLLSTARQHWLSDQHDAALQAFRTLHRQRPDDLRLAVEVANYLGMRFEVPEATEILKACEARLAGHAQAMFQVGLAYERAYRADDAFRCFRACGKGHPGALIKTVAWLERRGFVDEAWHDLGDASFPEALLWRGRLLQRRKLPDESERVLLALSEQNDAALNVRVDARYELAEHYDRRDDPAEAIRWAKLAKQLQRPQWATHLNRARAMAPIEANFVSTVTRDHFARWDAELQNGQETEPPIALLTGPPRSGTSMMARMLGMHDDLPVADEIEAYPTYLQPIMLKGKSGTSAAEVLDSLKASHVNNCRKLYRRWMSNALGKDVTSSRLLDKFPSTTFLIPPFRRLFPDATIVMAIRDPRDVVVSCFLRNLELNPVSVMFGQLPLTVMRCRAELKAWLGLREKLTTPYVEVRYEGLVNGDFSQLARVHECLGLEWRDEFSNIKASLSDQPVRSPTYAQLREQIDDRRVARWELYRDFLQPELASLNELAAEMGYQ